MNRRAFLTSTAATGSVIAVSGCLGILGGGDDGGGDDEQVGHRITDDDGDNYVMNRVDFVDQAGTLGQLAHMENDTEADDLLNTYSEADWQRMNDNDLEFARQTLENNALDEQKLQYMKNIGRGMQLFYEAHDGRTNLAVGGTLQEPAFYEFPDAMKDTLWNFEYDSLAEHEG